MSMIIGMSPSTVVGTFVAMAGACFALSKLSTIFSCRKEIHSELKQIVRGMGSLGCCSSKLTTMAVGLTGWINEATEGENRTEAAKRILKCYVAQLQGKTDETATKLDLERLGLKTLPTEIGLLTRLERLVLSGNPCTTLSTEIGRLTSLGVLGVDNNQLTTLPTEIERLTSLEDQHLINRQLTTVPSEIGELTSLELLTLEEELPTLEDELLTPEEELPTLDHLINRQSTMTDLLAARSLRQPPEIAGLTSLTLEEELPTQEEELGIWGIEATLEGCSEEQKTDLREFLKQLTGCAEYENQKTRNAFKIRVSDVFTQISTNKDSQELWLEVIRDSLTDCADRTSVGFSRLEIRFKQILHTKKAIDSSDTESEASIALKEFHKAKLRFDILECYVIEKMKKVGYVDEIEVWLYFMTKLKEPLSLPIETEGMLYETFAESALGLSAEDIQAAQQFVISKMDETDIEEELSNWGPWQQVQRAEQWRKFNFDSLATQMVADTEVGALTLDPVSGLGSFFVLKNGEIVSKESLKECWITNGKDPFTRVPIVLNELKKVKIEIHAELQKIIDSLGLDDLEMLNQINIMAVGLTGWINEATDGENRVAAANRILEYYLAQLKGKTDETATKLSLGSLGLKKLPPPIGELTSLTKLCLSNNQLTTLPPQIWELTSLEHLYLSNNKLTTLSAEIRRLTRLKDLTLYHNQLIALPGSIFDVGCDYSGITSIGLSYNLFSSDDLSCFANALNQHIRFDTSTEEQTLRETEELTELRFDISSYRKIWKKTENK